MKRYIRTATISEDEYYAHNVEDELDPSVEAVINSDIQDIDYSTLKSAVDAFFVDKKKIPSGWDELNVEYDRDKGRIYNKYLPFVKKCKEISEVLHPTGYGKLDYIDVKKKELCKSVDFQFPYGWKSLGSYLKY